MVQRKVPSKLGIQAEHVKSDKRLANMKLSSSQHQDGKSRGADMKKKMRKSRSIKLSDLEALQSSSPLPSRRSLSQPGKPPPLHIPTTTAPASPQKQQPLLRTTDGSPNYMKPTSSSHAKKELFPVSHRNPQSGSDCKNLPRKFSTDSKAACAKKPSKALARSSSLSLVRTLTKTTSFKASRACSRKSSRAVMCADMSAPQRATCSSTLKDSKFPSYLMLSAGATESEGTSAMKVCPYTYCSLNGHHHVDLPPLKSFMSARRRLLKTQKRAKLEALSPPRLKVPLETDQKEQNVSEEKPACDEIGIDIFIEIYANEKDAKPTGAEEMGRRDFLKEIEDQADSKSSIEDNGIAASEAVVMQVITPRIIGIPSPSVREIDLEEDLKKPFDDVAIEVDTKGNFLQEQNSQDADEDHQPIVWCHEEMSMGSYCSDGEQDMGDVDMDDSDSRTYEMEWKEERYCGFDPEEDADSSVYTEEDNDSKVESSSESSHDVSVTWLDDILGSYYEDFLVDETHKEANSEENTHFEEPSGISSVLEDTNGNIETKEIEYSPTGTGRDQSPFTEEIFEYMTNAQDNGGEDEKHVDDEASCNTKTRDQETIDNTQCQKMSETGTIDETSEDGYSSSLENNDDGNKRESQIELVDVSEESNMADQDQDLLEKDQGKGIRFQRTSCIGGEEESTSKNWKDAIRRKRAAEDDDEMRKFNPKEPNFLPLVPEPEKEKVDLRHQMMDERKNSEEWMLDCALRQAVTKLAPARKKKVALLVEAFETVMPAPKCENRVRNNSAFSHAGRIQACS